MHLLFLILIILISSEVNSQASSILKLSCEYEPNLIERKKTDSLENQKLDTVKICETFSCNDIVEIIKDSNTSNHRLINSWFNHQGILLDDFSITKDKITINTVVSNAYFLESYIIDRITGKTERIFYRFDNTELFDKINELKKSKENSKTLYNKNGRLSLKTLKLFSLDPWEAIYFKGECFEGTKI